MFGVTLSWDEIARTSQAIGDVHTLPLELQGLTSTVTTDNGLQRSLADIRAKLAADVTPDASGAPTTARAVVAGNHSINTPMAMGTTNGTTTRPTNSALDRSKAVK